MDASMGESSEKSPECTIDNSSYEKLHKARTLAEEIVSKMLSIKNEGKPKSELRELVTQMFLNFVALRQFNRSILLEEDRAKEQTEHTKAPLHFASLQLESLMYEKMQYVNVIKGDKEFKSKYPDIDIVSEEELFNDAPDAIKNSVMSNDSAHDLMLKRLNFELFQRKELCKLHQKLEEKKKNLLEIIAIKKKFLLSLPSHLKSLKKASLSVQQQLGVQHAKKLKPHQSSELVPPPLYVIYSQLLTQKEAFGESIDVEIVGSLKDAQAFACQQANKDTGTPSSENFKLENDDLEEGEYDEQIRRKRIKRDPHKDNLDRTGLYQTHPLKIILHIHDDDISDANAVSIMRLRFEYLLKLNVVCVGIEGSQEHPENNILCNLFPNDNGLVLPYQPAKLWFGDTPAFDEKMTARPYKWAQHLAGMDFLPELPPLLTGCETLNNETAKHTDVISCFSLYRQQSRVQAILQKIRYLKKAQQVLT